MPASTYGRPDRSRPRRQRHRRLQCWHGGVRSRTTHDPDPVLSGAGEQLAVFVAVLFILVGLTFIIAGVRARRSSRQFASVAVRAPGTVTELRWRKIVRGHTGGGGWFPVLRFATADGRHVHTEAIFGRMPAPARPGDSVSVLYDPADPTRAALEGHTNGALTGTIGIILGSLFVALGLGILGILVLVRHLV